MSTAWFLPRRPILTGPPFRTSCTNRPNCLRASSTGTYFIGFTLSLISYSDSVCSNRCKGTRPGSGDVDQVARISALPATPLDVPGREGTRNSVSTSQRGGAERGYELGQPREFY